MRPSSLHLVACLLLLAGAASAAAQAQDEAPAQIHTPTLNPHHRHRAEDLSWLWHYAEPAPAGRQNELVADANFKPFLKANLTAPQSFWGPEPLADVAREFLSVPGAVLADSNRYLSIDGCVPHFCPDRGLLWIDTGTSQPLTVFAAIDWIKDNRATTEPGSAYTLWLFPSRPLNPTHLPAALLQSLTRWTNQPSSGAKELQNITRVFLVDPDGTPRTIAPATAGAHNTLPAETTDEGRSKP